MIAHRDLCWAFLAPVINLYIVIALYALVQGR